MSFFGLFVVTSFAKDEQLPVLVKRLRHYLVPAVLFGRPAGGAEVAELCDYR
jgi:hypothetical protein